MPETQKLRYIGPIKSIGVPALGKSVERGHQVDVEDADLAASLLEQDDWEAVGNPKPKGARRSATPPEDPPPTDND